MTGLEQGMSVDGERMSKDLEHAERLLATIQEARMRLRVLSHTHLSFGGSLRIALGGVDERPSPLPVHSPVLHRRATVLRLAREAASELATGEVHASLLAAPRSRPARRQLAIPDPKIGVHPVADPGDEEATLIAAAMDESLFAHDGTLDAGSDVTLSMPESGDDEETIADDRVHTLSFGDPAGFPDLAEPDSEDFADEDDEDAPLVHWRVDDPAEVSAHGDTGFIEALEHDDGDDEPTRLGEMPDALRVALTQADDFFDDPPDDSPHADDVDDEEATRISRIPPEVLRTLAERRAAREPDSAPIFKAALLEPDTDSQPFATHEDDSLFGGDEDDGFSYDGDSLQFEDPDVLAAEDDSAGWKAGGIAAADFDVVFDDDGLSTSDDPDDDDLGDDHGLVSELGTSPLEASTSWGNDPLVDDEPDENDRTMIAQGPTPGLMLNAPRAVRPEVRDLDEGPKSTTGGAAIQILGFGKARTLTPTLALGSAPESDEDEDELVLEGDGPHLALAFQEPEESTGAQVPVLTEESTEEPHSSMLNLDGSLSGGSTPNVDSGLTGGEARQYLQLAHSAEQAGRLRDAVVHYDDLLSHTPHNLDGHLGRGRCLVDLGDYSAAMSDFTRAEDIAPDSAEPVVEMGNLFFARKEWKKAIGYFDHALSMNSKHVMALCRRGICHYHRKRYDAANKDLLAAQRQGADVPGLDRYIRMAAKRASGKN